MPELTTEGRSQHSDWLAAGTILIVAARLSSITMKTTLTQQPCCPRIEQALQDVRALRHLQLLQQARTD